MQRAILQTLPRTTARSSLLPRPVPCCSRTSVSSIVAPSLVASAAQRRFAATNHAISNPTLASIEKRWENMPPQEQAQLWMALRDRMVEDWNKLTMQEKKASYWIAFGPHGPRALPPPGENWEIMWKSAVGVGISFVLFIVIRYFAAGPPPTLNKEWQEATNEYLKGQNSEPITGISSQGYDGPGYVQSKSKDPK